MDINYKTIIEFLCTNANNGSSENNNFSTKKNIMVSSDNFPKYISENFEGDKSTFYRYGITRYNNNQENVSFLTSLLTLLDKQFISLDKDEELSYLNFFMKQIREEVLKPNFKFELSSKFSKDILIDRIEKLKFNDGILCQLLIQILDVNLLIMDFKSEQINCLFNGDFLNPWKVTLLLAKNEDNWEPIFSDKKQYSFNDDFLKIILTCKEVIYFKEDFLNKSYSLLDSIEQIESFNVNDEIINNESENSDIEDTFINQNDIVKEMGLNKTKLKNMKKDEIHEILLQLNVNVDKSLVKSKMIDELLPYI